MCVLIFEPALFLRQESGTYRLVTVIPVHISGRGSSQTMSVSNALGCDVVLCSIVDQLWDMSINKSTTTVFEASFRAFRRFSDMYPCGSLNPTHLTISEEMFIYFVAHCFSFLQLKYSTINTYLAGIRFPYIKTGFQDIYYSRNVK